jgi:anti-sigma28 factor (negative regulator of flagellin synthesis)
MGVDALLDATLDARPKPLKGVRAESMWAVAVQSPSRVRKRDEQVQMRADDEQLEVVQRQVSRGEYEVNSQRVAMAILERIGVIQTRVPVRERGSGRALLGELSVPREA